MQTHHSRWITTLALLLVVSVFVGVALTPPLRADVMAAEDGVYETLGVVGLLFALVVFLVCALRTWRSGARTSRDRARSLQFAALALLMMVLAGEEVSWGQRILSVQSPAWFQQHNAQAEITIHNLEVFQQPDGHGGWKSAADWLPNCDRLFTALWLGMFVLGPLARRGSRRLDAWFESVGVVPVPLCLGLVFPFTYVVSKVLERLAPRLSYRAVIESKEALIETLFVFVALVQLLSLMSERRPGSMPDSNSAATVGGAEAEGEHAPDGDLRVA